jgi:hypothetical protein
MESCEVEKMSELEAEFGEGWNITKFEAKLMTSAGKELLCACGKSASASIIGKEAFAAWCVECSPMSKEEEYELLVRPMPKEIKEMFGIRREQKANE